MKAFRLIISLSAWCVCLHLCRGQNIITTPDEPGSHWAENDSIEKENVPIGVYVWNIEERFGSVSPAEPDTVSNGFQNDAFTEGRTGRYNSLGNLGSPRLSRIFYDRWESNAGSQFIFERPYDFFITQPGQFLFTNTKSPFTNLTYHECGNKTNGEDRIKAIFATNVNKRLGIGFKLDYLYGRGYYPHQSTSQFNGTLFGSYRGERYQMHAIYYANHLKTAENGGLESDIYITDPESLPTKYGTADMPTNLSKTWNRLNVNTLYFTQRYNVGIRRYKDEKGRIVSTGDERMLKLTGLNTTLADSTAADSTGARQALAEATAEAADSMGLKMTFIPVAGFVHTMRIDHNNRRFVANGLLDDYYANYYLPGDSANDLTKNLYVANTLAFELQEGFNNWVKSGMRLFARHEYNRFTLPDEQKVQTAYTYNYITVGAQLLKREGHFFHYNVLGELRTTGSDWGEFNVEGGLDLNVPLRRDTLTVWAGGYVRNEQPIFYYLHYHGRNAWWDNDFDKVMRTRIGGSLKYKETKLSVFVETIQNYLYFAEEQQPYTGNDDMPRARFGVSAQQSKRNIQVIAATLNQNFRWGVLNWENEFTYQVSSEKDLLPLPAFSGYTNLYLQFRIAKVLRTELGADLRYFTQYYAPAYSPIIGQYCVQDPAQRVKIGNYPIANVYANFHLKRCRFYVMASHVNYSGKGGRSFLVPHYPINGRIFRLGISWNFFN